MSIFLTKGNTLIKNVDRASENRFFLYFFWNWFAFPLIGICDLDGHKNATDALHLGSRWTGFYTSFFFFFQISIFLEPASNELWGVKAVNTKKKKNNYPSEIEEAKMKCN